MDFLAKYVLMLHVNSYKYDSVKYSVKSNMSKICTYPIEITTTAAVATTNTTTTNNNNNNTAAAAAAITATVSKVTSARCVHTVN
jgi:hypothetical protein